MENANPTLEKASPMTKHHAVSLLLLAALFVAATPTAIAQTSTTDDVPAFVDVEGNAHEENIRLIVGRGLTVGCDSVGPRYCPDDPVTRAQIAAFLVRALNLDTSGSPSGVYPDVLPDAWYAPHVETLGLLGLTDTQISGAYRPDDVMLRSEMAVFLQKAFRLYPAGADMVFVDVPTGAAYAGAVGAIAEAGVTRGCSVEPPGFCPDETVRRDTMASFLARAIRHVELEQKLVYAPDREILESVSVGEHTWDVWVCENVPVDGEEVAEFLNREVSPYYEWLSGGVYQPRFRHGANPSANVAETLDSCEAESHMYSYNIPEGANVFVGGNLTASHRDAVGAGGGELDREDNRYDQFVFAHQDWAYDRVLYGHEIGHTYGWPHHFAQGVPTNRHTGNLELGMDIMASGGRFVGTNAHNLFHVGWIHPDNVAVHSGGDTTYTLHSPQTRTGVGLVMLPLSSKQVISVGARTQDSYDKDIPEQGVEVLEITFCGGYPWSTTGCKETRLPPGSGTGTEPVVLGVGEVWNTEVVRELPSGRPVTVSISLSVTDNQNGTYANKK